jgi:putative NIF3 family GTP cyclohydrolase 1 type 2
MAVFHSRLPTFSTRFVHILWTIHENPLNAVTLEDLAAYLDDYLRVREVPDYPAALNGVQVESPGRQVRRIAVAVDAAQATVDAAVKEGADLLLVHHGLFWDGNVPVTGRRYRRLRAVMDAGMGVYAAHLPLDVHPEVGNNAVLARALGIEPRGTFGEYKGWPLGVWGELEIRREALAARLDELLGGPVKMVDDVPRRSVTAAPWWSAASATCRG